MDPLWISVAFILGLAARQLGLPPLVGFLIAGFVLHAIGVEGGEVLDEVADLGVALLLFSIGLKLRIKSLLSPEVWAGAGIHMLITVGIFTPLIFALGLAGVPFFADLDLPLAVLVAFALSFSSTVFAVKVLEEKGEMSSLHGRVAIGILIMQDVFAVLFLTVSTGKFPSPWALAVPVALWGLRPLLLRLMDRAGHGELLVLYGMFAGLVVGAAGFELVGLKPDLGALVLGVVLAGHAKASELAKSLMGFKDLFLVGFFLTIGLSGLPEAPAVGVALLLVVAVPFKVALFFALLTRFKLRARTATLASLSLANYSEFGLIVAAVGAANGWINSEWLVIIAIALTITFVLAAPLNTRADGLYSRFTDALRRFETPHRHPDDQPISPGEATISIFGMGRIGTSAYDYLRRHYGETVIGFDFDAETVRKQQADGRNVLFGDPTDPDFWVKLETGNNEARLVLLAMPKHAANLAAARHLLDLGFRGTLAATAQFDDQVRELKDLGVQAAFNFYAEAGVGFAEHVLERLRDEEAGTV